MNEAISVTQLVFNIVVSVAGSLCLILIKVVFDSIRELQLSQKEVVDKLSQVSVCIASDYVKKDECTAERFSSAARLDRLEDKLTRQ